MTKEYITENQLVFETDKGVKRLAKIVNVRQNNGITGTELMYDLHYLISGKYSKNVHEESGMTYHCLNVISKEDALNMILTEEYNLDIKIAKLNKQRIKLINSKSILNSI